MAIDTIQTDFLKDREPPTPRQILLQKTLVHKGFMIGAAMLLLMVLMALFAPVLAPHDPFHQDLANRLVEPVWHETGSWEHPLGTDNLGRDYLSRLMHGARICLTIGLAAMAISMVLGTALGIAAGY